MSDENNVPTPWLNSKEAAQYTGLALSTVRNKVCAGEIPFHRKGRIVRFHRSELDAWLRGDDAQAAEEA